MLRKARQKLSRKLQGCLPNLPTQLHPFVNGTSLPNSDTAKLFLNGRSQAVRLPKEFRFQGDRVRIRRIAQGVLLEPLIPNTAKWFEELDHFNSEPFPPRGRRQPATPKRKIF
jgi:antitoxin VapB